MCASRRSPSPAHRPSEPSTAAWKARTALTSLRPADRPAEAISRGQVAAGTADDLLLESLCYACLTSLDPMLMAPAERQKVDSLPPWVAGRLGRHGRQDAADDLDDGEAEAGHLAGSHGGGRIVGQAELESIVKEFIIDA